MGKSISDFFAHHRLAHGPQKPDLSKLQYCDELEQIGIEEGLFEFSSPPAEDITIGRAPGSWQDQEAAKTKYLWAVAKTGIPAALEIPVNGTHLMRGRLAHTNLTGGEEAHTAGELWFYDKNSIVINGGSSRYKPRSPEELTSVARAFKDAGYKVADMGWDEETDGPCRILRGDPKWI